MTRTLKHRIEALESQPRDMDHDWQADIGWEGEDCHYYRDGVEIPRGQYFREAPHQPLTIHFRELIVGYQNLEDPELWHLDRERSGEPIPWHEIEKRHPDNRKLKITADGKPELMPSPQARF